MSISTSQSTIAISLSIECSIFGFVRIEFLFSQPTEPHASACRARFQPTPFRFHTRPDTDITITHRMCWIIGMELSADRCCAAKQYFHSSDRLPNTFNSKCDLAHCLNSMESSYLCIQQSVVIHEGFLSLSIEDKCD